MKKSWIFPINEVAITLTYVLPIVLNIDHLKSPWWYVFIAIELLIVPCYILWRKNLIHRQNTTYLLRLINVPLGAFYFWIFGLGWLLVYCLAIGVAHYATTKEVRTE